jgi:hypothetical protein
MSPSRFAIAVSIFVCVCSGDAMSDEPMDFKITPRQGIAVDVKAEKDRTILDVTSPTGIGGAEIERRTADWPKVVIIRLRLKGLEHFELTAGKRKLEAAVAVRDGKTVVRAWRDGDENRPLDDKSPSWPRIAALDGWFDVEVPRAMLEGNPPTIAVSWIDFYRN